MPGGAARHLNVVMVDDKDAVLAETARTVSRRVRCEGASLESMNIVCGTVAATTLLSRCLPERWGQSLKALRVQFREIDIDHLRPIIMACPKLEHLTLRTAYYFVSTDAWEATMSILPASLTSLHIEFPGAEGALDVRHLARLERLERLVLDYDHDSTPITGIKDALVGLRSLRELSLLRCATTATDVPAILSACSTALESLELGPVFEDAFAFDDEESLVKFVEAAKAKQHLRSLSLHDHDCAMPCSVLELILRDMTRLTAFGCGMAFSAYTFQLEVGGDRFATLRDGLRGLARLDLSSVLRTAPRDIDALLGIGNLRCHIVIGPVDVSAADSAHELHRMSTLLAQHPGGFSHRMFSSRTMADVADEDRMLCLYVSPPSPFTDELADVADVADALAPLLRVLRGLLLTWRPSWLEGERTTGELLLEMKPMLIELRVLATQFIRVRGYGRHGDMHILPGFVLAAADMDGVREVWFKHPLGVALADHGGRGKTQLLMAAYASEDAKFKDYLEGLRNKVVRIDAGVHSPMWHNVHKWYASASPDRRDAVKLNLCDDEGC